MLDISKMLGKRKELSLEEISELLRVDPEALAAFEESYQKNYLKKEPDSSNLFDINSRQAKRIKEDEFSSTEELESGIVENIIDRLSSEFLAQIGMLSLPSDFDFVSPEEVDVLPEALRPQMLGNYIKRDIAEKSYPHLLYLYNEWLKDPVKNIKAYHMFRQGLDILDLDPITYEIIGKNVNSMGYWFYPLKKAAESSGFFKIPETKIVKVPLPILQLTRLDYMNLSPTTLKIVNNFCMDAFDLDVNKTYFIRTGTYSSKFDFRNAKVTGEKEVMEIGEYLLYIHFQALQMASPLSTPTIYGVSTTNEWVVREFVEDVEDNPCIYKGMPLHTEYRVFVDADKKEVLGIHPYWDPEVMKENFLGKMKNKGPRAGHDFHDYLIYQAHEEVLMKRYEKNKDLVVEKINDLLKEPLELNGQWSIDVMQNGDDFYLIDMALAENSAFYSEAVPEEKRLPSPEDWLPALE